MHEPRQRHAPSKPYAIGADVWVSLGEHRLADARGAGLLQERRYPPVGPYGARNAARQVTGRLGEWAFLDWARDQGRHRVDLVTSWPGTARRSAR